MINQDFAGADEEFLSNLKNLRPIDEIQMGKILRVDFVEKNNFVVINGVKTTFDFNDYRLNLKNFLPESPPGRKGISIVRYLESKHPDLFRATDDELKNCLPKDLPKLMVINEWYHEDYGKVLFGETYGKKPSSYETFPLIAKVLVSQDTSLYKPKLKPNNHWKNWPNAGMVY